MKYTIVFISILFHFSLNSKTQHSIVEWINALKFNADKYWDADVGIATTKIDTALNYIQVYSESQELILCEGHIFQVNKNESVFLVQGIESDEQCTHFHQYCFQGNPLINKIEEKSFGDYFQINLDSLLSQLVSSNVLDVITKYLPQIRSEYLNDNAQIIDVLKEFFDLHLKFDMNKMCILINLIYCDYIPLNAVNIELEDQETIQNGSLEKLIVFNKKHKKFNLK